ncbi:hypothetical protein [Chengkuizengella axinellae]|uniref:YgiT-type zinc finger protein n=1 Tax=Chengkuizengella axinellae TaxID=3064388 RepID=A0ABT9J3J9_9BACL|nr:hypothetical protein [Chengkuizengella sp. 2205SS18-9]MDP5276173.1 hypothetical protein [Chengkuizengella sp. 2205SS18-9]
MSKVGRPKSSNPREFHLPDIRLTREEKRMIELKAILHEKGNVSQYIRSLVENDRREVTPLKSCSCGSTDLKVVYKDDIKHVDIGGSSFEIPLKSVPYNECNECGEELGDLRLHAKIDEIVDEEVTHRLNHKLPVPFTLNLFDVISPSQI